MVAIVAIPGRRLSGGETFRTNWMPRGGDCVILRVEVLHDDGGGSVLKLDLETRGEDGTTVTTMTPTSTGLEVATTGVATCVYLAKEATTPGNGAQEQVRVVVTCTSGEGGYYVVRIFPLIFFDSAREY